MEMTPREFAFWPNPIEPTFGLLLCEDAKGRHWTLRGDPELVRMARDAPPNTLSDADLGGEWEAAEGWPDEWV